MQVVDITVKFVENSIYFVHLTAQKLKLWVKAWEIKISRQENLGFFPIFWENFYNHFLNLLHTPVDANDFSHAYRHEIVNEVKNIPWNMEIKM